MLPINYTNMFSACKSLSNLPLTGYYGDRDNYEKISNHYYKYHSVMDFAPLTGGKRSKDLYNCLGSYNKSTLFDAIKEKVKEKVNTMGFTKRFEDTFDKYNNYNNKVDKFTHNFSSNELGLLNMLSEEDKILFKTAKQLESKYNLQIEKDNIKNGNKLSTLNIFISVFIALTLISLVSLHTVSIIIFTTLSVPLFIFTKKIRLKLKRKELIKLMELYD